MCFCSKRELLILTYESQHLSNGKPRFINFGYLVFGKIHIFTSYRSNMLIFHFITSDCSEALTRPNFNVSNKLNQQLLCFTKLTNSECKFWVWISVYHPPICIHDFVRGLCHLKKNVIIASITKIMTSHFAISIEKPAIPLAPSTNATSANIRKTTASPIKSARFTPLVVNWQINQY